MRAMAYRIVTLILLLAATAACAAPATSQPAIQPATPREVTQKLFDLLKVGEIDKAMEITLPIKSSPDPNEVREKLQRMSKAMKNGGTVDLGGEKSIRNAALIVLVFRRANRPNEVDPDPGLLVKRGDQWRLLMDDPEQHDLTAAELADLKQLKDWFKANESDIDAKAATSPSR